MLPPIIAQTVPGQELAQSVLNADAIQAMQLIVFLVVVGWILSVYLNGRSVSQMSQTQNNMSQSNERFFEADARRTATMQSSIDELRLLRESYEENQQLNQQSLDAAAQAAHQYDEKAEARNQTIISHTSTLAVAQANDVKDAVSNLIGEATAAINTATIAALETAGKPALEAIGDLRKATESLQTLQKEQMALMKRQQDAQIDTLKDLFDGQMNILTTQIDRAEKRLILTINLAQGATSNDVLLSEIPEVDHTRMPELGGADSDSGGLI
jgi:hypothetical protein